METEPPPRTPLVQIGSARIGPGQPAYVIAEAGVNHNGDVATGRTMIRRAADAGANAIKFQAFSADRLVTATAPAVAYQQPVARTQREMLRGLELSAAAFAELRDACEAAAIEFLATPFGPQDVAMLAALGVRGLKIASTDIVNAPLLDAALATRLPLIVSTGAATAAEIDGMVARAERAGARDRLVLLHCVSAYPTDEACANLRAVQTLRDRYACVTGFSDHTRSNACAGLAVAAGAAVLEKHFTLDRKQPGPDHAFSLEPTQLAEYVDAVRRAERICGDGKIGVLDCEREVRQLARASVVAARALRAGETLGQTALAVKRPGGGIAPDEMHRLLGRTVKCNVPEDTPLTWAVVD